MIGLPARCRRAAPVAKATTTRPPTGTPHPYIWHRIWMGMTLWFKAPAIPPKYSLPSITCNPASILSTTALLVQTLGTVGSDVGSAPNHSLQ